MLILIVPTHGAVPEDATRARVRRILDGDTIVVWMDGEKQTLRLEGIDAPELDEKEKKNNPEDWQLDSTRKMKQALQQKAYRAGQFLAHHLRKQKVVLVQVTRREKDRLVGHVFLKKGQHPLGLRAVHAGYARVPTADHDFGREAEYLRAQVQSMAAQRGLWALRKHCKSPAEFFIGVRGDAHGAERQKLNDEYVVIGNISSKQYDLSNHIIVDEDKHRFVIPEDTALKPGESLVIRTGTGESKGLELHRNMDGPAWNNEGDTVHVFDPEGTEITRMSYGVRATSD